MRRLVLVTAFVACLSSAVVAADGQVFGDTVKARVRTWRARLAPPAYADSLLALGARLRDRGEVDLAGPILRDALAVRTRVFGAGSHEAADVHGELMLLAYGAGDLDAAWSHQSSVVDALEALDAPPDERGDALFDLAYLADARSRPELSEPLWGRAGRALAAVDPPDHRLIALTESSRAEALRLLGRFDAAESLMVAVIARSRRHLPRTSDHAKLLNNLGVFYWDEGRLDEAERLYRESLRIREADDPPDTAALATAYQNLGVLRRDQGDLDEAERLLTHALALARSGFAPDDPALAYFPLELGTLHALAGDASAAVPLWDEALAVLRRSPIPRPLFEAKILADVGMAHLDAGDLGRAEGLLSDARARRVSVLGADHPDVASVDVGRALVSEARGDDVTARRLLTPALAVLEKTALAGETTIEGLALQARLQHRAGDGAGALETLLSAIARLDDLRSVRGGDDLARARLLAGHLDVYEQAIAWAVDDGTLTTALRVAEAARARALRDRLLASHVDPAADLSPERRAELTRREQAARLRVNAARRALRRTTSALGTDDPSEAHRAREAELEDAARAYADVSDEIRLLSPAWSRVLRVEVDDDPLRTASDVIGASEHLWLYAIGRSRSFLFVVGPDARIEAYEIPVTAAALADAVARIGLSPGSDMLAAARGVTGLGSGETGRVGSTARTRSDLLHDLWARVVPPDAWAHIREDTAITVVPDGALHALPLEALVTELSPSGPAYWLDSGPVVRYAHSIGAQAELRRLHGTGERRTGHVLTLSDPAYGGTGGAPAYPRLPGTRRESDAIVRAFGPGTVHVLEGEEATEAALLSAMPDARILHLATHGIVETSRSGLLAALVLAEARDPHDDGYLHLFEVHELNLDCNLAVLSACDTSLGEYVRGEGVFALSRAFIAAGVRRTVASLWAVNDEATAVLIQTFMNAVATSERAAGPVPYARHLRDAKRRVREDPRWADPYYWAGLVLAGLP